ncbi:MAG: universal stress protein [Candidatus Nitrosotenuis sp.]
MSFKKILVPIDGSTYSAKALRTATEIAQKHESEIVILACMRKEDVGAWYYSDPKINQHIIRKAKEFAKQSISKLEESITKKGVNVTSGVIEVKSLVHGITDFADSKKVDLIVMGSHGRTGFKKMLLGSVSNGVVQQAKQPVLIVK